MTYVAPDPGSGMITSTEQPSVAGSAPIQPSRLWYWVTAGLLAGAAVCVALALAGFFSLNRQIKDFQRVAVPGQAVVTFAHPGDYVLYIEKPGHCCSFAANTGDSVPFPSWSVQVGLQPWGGGPPVSISTWRGVTESYSVTGHQGQAAMAITIGHPGKYVLRAADAAPRSITDVAVGRGIGHGLLFPLLLALVALVALIPAGLLFGGITAVRRRRARRGLRQVIRPMKPEGPR
jgi:hypothetical protein